jgi:hypothetical protein
MLHVYGSHWLTLKKQKAGHLRLERNFMPWQALFDYDFAEKFTVIVRNEIQITLFIGISQHLDMSAWNDLEVTLALSQEVTIAEPGKIPFWAVWWQNPPALISSGRQWLFEMTKAGCRSTADVLCTSGALLAPHMW